MAATTDSLYARLGGTDAIGQVTTGFYGRVLQDPCLAPHFERTDMHQQTEMLTAFLVMATGGPAAYRGRGLREAHASLNLTDRDFDLVVGHLAAELAACGVSEQDIKILASVAESVRGEVLGR
jgi:truncated hemoglobin YjbI